MKSWGRIGGLLAVAIVCFVAAYAVHNHAGAVAGLKPSVISANMIVPTSGIENASPSTGGHASAITGAKDVGDVDITGIAAKAAFPTASQGPDDVRQRAIEAFKEQRRSWLSIRTVSARYTLEATAKLPSGEQKHQERSGSIELLIKPIEDGYKANHYYTVTARVTEDIGLTFVKENIYDTKTPVTWRIDKPELASHVNQAKLPMRFNSMCLEDILEPLNGMSGTYRDGIWAGGPKRNESEFLQMPKVFERVSTSEETAGEFAGESTYLMHLAPVSNYRYWFSRDTGELRFFDKTPSVLSGAREWCRYDRYTGSENAGPKFPARFTKYLRLGDSQADVDETVTVELTKIAINQPISLADLTL